MSKAADVWNALPFEERSRLQGCIIERQVLDYKIERERAIAAHKKHLAEIDSHLKNCQRDLAKWEGKPAEAPGGCRYCGEHHTPDGMCTKHDITIGPPICHAPAVQP